MSDWAHMLVAGFVGGCIALFLAGCGASAYQHHYQAIGVALAAHGTAADVAEETLRARLEAAQTPELAAAEGERMRPVGAALDGVLGALDTWAVSVRAARRAGDESLLPSLLEVGGRVMQLYEDVRRLLAAVGVTVPELSLGGS
jgi:hypothetical protein